MHNHGPLYNFTIPYYYFMAGILANRKRRTVDSVQSQLPTSMFYDMMVIMQWDSFLISFVNYDLLLSFLNLMTSRLICIGHHYRQCGGLCFLFISENYKILRKVELT